MRPGRGPEIKTFILENLPSHPKDIVTFTADHFATTRTTVHRHLSALIKQDKVTKTGTTANTVYTLANAFEKLLTFDISQELSESAIWQDHFSHLKTRLPDNVYDICYYGFTEMVNNAIDHSEGRRLTIISEREKNRMVFIVRDDGVGIFKKIKDAKGLPDEREALLVLTKGKFTTDPSRHSGEGIFFSSRVFDQYCIMANGLAYIRDNQQDDWFFEERANLKDTATYISMKIDIDSKRRSEEVFRKYVDPETQAFNKTHILVNLSLSNEERFVSRSQAKRVLTGLEKFKHIILDFKSVQAVGQAFVDEVFRVFADQHPDVTIDTMNANENIKFMIERGIATARANKLG